MKFAPLQLARTPVLSPAQTDRLETCLAFLKNSPSP